MKLNPGFVRRPNNMSNSGGSEDLQTTGSLSAPECLKASVHAQQEPSCFINRLPNETLGDIFLLTMSLWVRDLNLHTASDRAYYRGWIFVTGVCRRWYDVTIHLPSLWSHLLLPCDEAFAMLLLQRSQDAPLYVYSRSPPANASSSDSPGILRMVLEQHFHHVRELSLHIDRKLRSCDSVLDTLDRPAVKLRALKVKIDGFDPEMATRQPLHPLGVLKSLDRHCAPWRSTLQELDLENRPFSLNIMLSMVLDVLTGVPLLRKLRLRNFIIIPRGELQAVQLKNLEECDLLSTPAACVALLQRIEIAPNTKLFVAYNTSGEDHEELIAPIVTKLSNLSSLLSFGIFASPRFKHMELAGWKSPVGVERKLDLSNSAFRLAFPTDWAWNPSLLQDLLRPLPLLSVQYLHLHLSAKTFPALLTNLIDIPMLSGRFPNIIELTLELWPAPVCIDAICNPHLMASGNLFVWPALTTLVLENVFWSKLDSRSIYYSESVKLLREGLLKRQAGGCAMLDRVVVRLSELEESDLSVLQDCCREIVCERNRPPGTTKRASRRLTTLTTLLTATGIMTTTATVPPVVEEGKLLSESLSTVKIQVQQMRRYLELDQLMDALKSASLMLAELRTSSLSPKQYYELYMAVFDALRHLSNYLYDAHTQGRHHLADLYELVQYAGNIVPRLYLMITVGSVYMSIPDAPVKEIMKDMMEMSRGVLHPIRGLFLRHYLSGQTRDHLPVGNDPGPCGNLQDSITFELTNFIEMNKLWVRLQHQGHSRDREKREMERKDLRILVGTNLVRLSQLEGVDLELYKTTILPSILQQVVSCKDVIAQEYLMEVVIQVFTDEFHLYTLGPFLSATAQLHPKVNIKQIVIALIDRLAAYAAREAENEDPDETKRQEEAAARRLAEKVKIQKARIRQNSGVNGTDAPETPTAYEASSEWHSTVETAVTEEAPTEETATVEEEKEEDQEKVDKGKEKAQEEPPVKKFRGIPENVKLFEVFWQQVVELIKARPDLSIQDITALLVSLTNLSLSCYPDRLEYVDQVLGFAHDKIQEFTTSADLHSPQTTANLAALLLAPINSYQSVLTLLALQRYSPLLAQQPFSTRRSLAHAVISSVLKNETIIETPEDVNGILELCHVLIKDQQDATVNPQAVNRERRNGPIEPGKEELAEEQGWIARMVHLFRAESLDVQFELLQTARRHFELGGDRMRFTYPALITATIKLCRRKRTGRAKSRPSSSSSAS
ncbi:hypothetical protein NM688_g732 [Phlebia brevispora]|uniref:Uncharacterized protein n=1 Tax=Phlebia brevispora TaxID=194682 RepID=A0ACC1TD99_9APHY|nr:hypothetical protein NM688_g732 [Phlebia brevispora]